MSILSEAFRNRWHALLWTLCVLVVLGAMGCLSDPADVQPPDDLEDTGPSDASEDSGDQDVDGGDADSCEPLSCDDKTVEGECQSFENECGETLVCGCTDNELCDEDSNECICIAESDSELCDSDKADGRCGTFSVQDRCDEEREIDCDPCASYEECWESSNTGDTAEGTELNTCYCDAVTCDELDASCGTFDDGCGGELDCDDGPELSCDDDQEVDCVETDGAWEYECVDESCEPDPDCEGVCGSVDDGCGDRHDCGDSDCADYETCEGNACICDEDALEDKCDEVECGIVAEGSCTYDCGDCGVDCECEDNECSPHRLNPTGECPLS